MSKPNLKQLIEERGRDKSPGVWEQLRKGKQVHRDITWPGTEIVVRMRVLTSSESQLASANAYKRFIDIGLPMSPYHADEYTSEEVTQRLALALRDPETEELAFESADDLRDVSTDEERLSIWSAYSAMVENMAPDFSNLSNAEWREVEEAVKKKDAIQLSAFGLQRLVSYLLTLDSPPSSSPTDKSTPGQPAQT